MKLIPNFENYSITMSGRVINNITKKVKKPSDNHSGKGYLFVDLYCNGNRKRFYIHRLVAKLYIPNPDTPTTSCENCAKKSSCKLQNKVNFSELMPKMIVCDEFTPTKTDFKYFTAEQVRNMSQKEVRENYRDIMKSMKKWG